MRTKIRTRLGLGFAAMLVLVVVTAVVAVVNMNRIGQSMGMLTRQADQAAALGSIRAGVLNAQASLLIALDDRSSGVLSRASVLLDNFNDQVSEYEHPKDAEGNSMAALAAGNPEMAQSCARPLPRGPKPDGAGGEPGCVHRSGPGIHHPGGDRAGQPPGGPLAHG